MDKREKKKDEERLVSLDGEGKERVVLQKGSYSRVTEMQVTIKLREKALNC